MLLYPHQYFNAFCDVVSNHVGYLDYFAVREAYVEDRENFPVNLKDVLPQLSVSDISFVWQQIFNPVMVDDLLRYRSSNCPELSLSDTYAVTNNFISPPLDNSQIQKSLTEAERPLDNVPEQDNPVISQDGT